MTLTEFYENCEIFVTGGSGVVGKTLIEKLLRSCNVKRIYILLRPKKDMDAQQRLDKLSNEKIFRLLRSLKPNELSKLTAIPGDAVLPRLGITDEYMKMLENVSCIFHCAATTRFNEPIKVAVTLNIAGTLEALKFAMTLKNLKVFQHVSTFFSNPYLDFVEAKVYESPMDWRTCLKMLENEKNHDNFDILTQKMIIGFPNTYTFTKNLAESMVNEFRDRLPISIFRPSIVLFALEEPEPGFPPALMGAMALLTLMGAGILKGLYGSKRMIADITPQDMGVKTMIYYGYKAADSYKNGTPDEAPVYMFSSSKINPFSFRHMGETIQNEGFWKEAAFMKSLLVPHVVFTEWRWIYMYRVFVFQLLPASLVDFVLKMMGREPVLMGIMRKLYITLQVMEPFLFNQYDSTGITCVEDLNNELNGTDFDINRALSHVHKPENLKKNVRNMAYCAREVLLGEDPSTLPKSRRILKIKRGVSYIIQAVFYYFLLRWIYSALLNYF